MPAHQRTEERVRLQPRGIFLAPRGKIPGPPCFLPDLLGLEIFPRGLEQFALQRTHPAVIHLALTQRRRIMFGADLLVIRRRQVLQQLGIGRNRRRVQRQRTDDVVRAVVTPRFVDRQHLHHPEAMLRGPIDHLLERLRVADPEVVCGAQGKERGQQPGQLLIRGWFHRERLFTLAVPTSVRKSKCRDFKQNLVFAYYFLLVSLRDGLK